MRVQQSWSCWPRSFQGWRQPAGLEAMRRLCPYPAEDDVLFADMVHEESYRGLYIKHVNL